MAFGVLLPPHQPPLVLEGVLTVEVRLLLLILVGVLILAVRRLLPHEVVLLLLVTLDGVLAVRVRLLLPHEPLLRPLLDLLREPYPPLLLL